VLLYLFFNNHWKIFVLIKKLHNAKICYKKVIYHGIIVHNIVGITVHNISIIFYNLNYNQNKIFMKTIYPIILHIHVRFLVGAFKEDVIYCILIVMCAEGPISYFPFDPF